MIECLSLLASSFFRLFTFIISSFDLESILLSLLEESRIFALPRILSLCQIKIVTNEYIHYSIFEKTRITFIPDFLYFWFEFVVSKFSYLNAFFCASTKSGIPNGGSL